MSLIYTSGTTGPPKGVVYSHNNILWTLESVQRFWAIEPQVLVSYLPLAHVAERFTSLERTTSPFAVGAPPKTARWVEPGLVVEVRFSEWTAGGGIRQPTYRGVREDKDPREVTREVPR